MKPTILLLLFFMIPTINAQGTRNSQIITFKNNGAWCWFQDERAILHNGVLLFGTVADSHGHNGNELDGNIEITAYDIDAKQPIGTSILHEHLEADDHNVPALLLSPDNRVLAVYSKHGTDNKIRYRITQDSYEYLEWQAEKEFPRDAKVTYSNLFLLENENSGKDRLYNFYRGEDWNPNYVISDDAGETWRDGGHLIEFEGRPYVKYSSDSKSKIHFITTEHHPHNYFNSIYHAYMENGNLYTTDGTLIKSLADGPMAPELGTKIFVGDSLNVAWTIDMHLDKQGFPYIAYSVQESKNCSHIEYRYARWDGKKWQDNFLAFAGTCLYDAEMHYSGLVALDPNDPNTLYISTDHDPVKGTELISTADGKRHYEIFKGVTTSDGKTWSWTPMTHNSTVDNIRPIMPKSDGEHKVLLWLNGTYMDYKNFDVDIVGIVDP